MLGFVDRPTTWGTYTVLIYGEDGLTSREMSHVMLESYIDEHPGETLEARCTSQAYVPTVRRNFPADEQADLSDD